MSQYIKLFNTRAEYEAWASGYTEGYPVAAYIISENSTGKIAYSPFLEASASTTSFEYTGGTGVIDVKSNCNFTVSGSSWITLAAASGVCNQQIGFTVAPNALTKQSRNGSVTLSYNQTESEVINFTQSGNPSYSGIPNNEIWYTSTDGKVVTPYRLAVFGANIISNTYVDGKGIILFDGDVTLLQDAFTSRSNLLTISVPSSVKNTGSFSFLACSSIITITAGDGITSIGEDAFKNCGALTSLTLKSVVPPSLNSLAFYGSNNCTVYVPASSVEAYKSAANWQYMKSRIQAIPE